MAQTQFSTKKKHLNENFKTTTTLKIPQHLIKYWGGGVTTIHAGTGSAIFGGTFFRAENKLWSIMFDKIIGSHKFWGIILEKYLFRVLILIKCHLLV